MAAAAADTNDPAITAATRATAPVGTAHLARRVNVGRVFMATSHSLCRGWKQILRERRPGPGMRPFLPGYAS